MRAVSNACGRPNADVLRGYVSFADYATSEHWQVDFPLHTTAQEASLYEQPFALLRERVQNPAGDWWINPCAQPELRHALARLQRYLAMPFACTEPAWTWVEGDWLPGESLMVLAREDDFTHAVLQSRLFAEWWLAHYEELGPVLIAESFPSPWSLARPLGSLTGLQQDLRSAASRAARGGDSTQVNETIAQTYGWPANLDSTDILACLRELHRRRLDNLTRPFI